MENAVNALKMGGALMIFVLAFTLIMNMFSQAKHTMDTVMYGIDESNYYQHVSATDANVTRKVGVETIIPTLYTYVTNSDDAIRINIIAKDNELLQVFDSEIESIVEEKSNVSEYSLSEKEANILKRYNTEGTPVYLYGAPWAKDNNWAINRINAYVYGYDIYVKESRIPLEYSGKGLIDLVENDKIKFNESYVEYQTSGRIYWNENFDESLVQIDGSTKTIINYQVIEE